MKKDKNKELEMKNSSTQSNELNDDDLDNVAGGLGDVPLDTGLNHLIGGREPDEFNTNGLPHAENIKLVSHIEHPYTSTHT